LTQQQRKTSNIKKTANPWRKKDDDEVNYIREVAGSNIYRVLGSQESKSLTDSNERKTQ
jgi:hypothetical protein